MILLLVLVCLCCHVHRIDGVELENLVANLRSAYIESAEGNLIGPFKNSSVLVRRGKYRLVNKIAADANSKFIDLRFKIVDILMVVNENVVIVTEDEDVILHCTFDTEANAYEFFKVNVSKIPHPTEKFIFNLPQLSELRRCEGDTSENGNYRSKLVEKMRPASLTVEELPKIGGKDARRRVTITDCEGKYVVFSTSLAGISASKDNRIVLVVEERLFTMYFHVLHFESPSGDYFASEFGEHFKPALSSSISPEIVNTLLAEDGQGINDEQLRIFYNLEVILLAEK